MQLQNLFTTKNLPSLFDAVYLSPFVDPLTLPATSGPMDANVHNTVVRWSHILNSYE